ncbi:hypothetical protein B0T10DRAFT_213697 [Thelonectria olida]|uniref:SH3 domain-containing protein n=1 Tax=Thelonectria olida TaxID=1576542 RepID=A0A9P8WBA7_9HYPO|nr:hypothetical protein B0T10DRAFT_213697 [Thelonectria olida]
MRLSHVGLHRRDPAAVTVYVTAKATFTGKVGGYSTIGKPVIATKAAEEDDSDDDDKSATKKKEVAHTTAAPKATSTAKSVKEKETTEEEEEKTKEDKSSNEETESEAESKTNESDKATLETKTTKARALTTSTNEDSSDVPSAITDPTDSDTIDTVLAKATDQVSLSTAVDSGAATISTAEAVASSSATSEASSSSTSGSSAGAKAGIAFGVLGGLFLVGLIVFLLFSRRRKQVERQRLEDDDEKLHGPIDQASMFAGPAAIAATPEPETPRTDPKAPRISLRPVTQFLPNWNGLEKRTSKGATLALSVPAAGAPAPMTSRAPGGSAWERPTTAQSTDPNNPFGIQAERVPTPVMEENEQARSAAPSPVTEKGSMRPVSPVSSSGTDAPVVTQAAAVAVGAAAAGAGAASLTRKTSMRKDLPKPLDLTLPAPPLAPIPASPAGTEFSVSSNAPGAPEAPSAGAAAIAAAGGPVNSAVYRVQLDFKPTLDDELELRAGDLVRMLHEYDDGWALCIRLDRSRQGVVPRTCLSTRPVKPRPQGAPRPGPPVNANGPPRGPMGPPGPPGQRPMTPQGRPMTPQGRPQSPAGQRPMTPQGRPMTPQGRPQSPAGQRPMTPNGGRSQSPMGRPMNAPGAPAGRPMSPGPRAQSPGPRSQSPNGMNRQGRNSPPGPSPMNPNQPPAQGPPTGPVGRKPVPGQAY